MKPVSEMTLEEIDAELRNSPSNVKFKSPQVEQEYGALNPSIRGILENVPKPVTITSGMRSHSMNAAVGGVPGSYHTKGEAVDLRYPVDPETRSYLESSGLKMIPESDHAHFQPGDGYMNKKPTQPDMQKKDPSQMTLEEINAELGETDEPTSNGVDEIEGESNPDLSTIGGRFQDEMNDFKVSPLSLVDRFKTSFGNPEGIDEYMKSSGYSDQDISNARPNTNAGLASLTVPGMLMNSIEGKSGLADIGTTLADVITGGAIADIPATILNMIPFAGVKARQGIGEMFGTYKDPGEGYFNNEVVSQLPYDIAAVAMPGMGKLATRAEEVLSRPIKEKLISSELPERIYANATGLASTLVDEPGIVRTLLKNKEVGAGKDLVDRATMAQTNIGEKMNEALSGKSFKYSQIKGKIPGASSIVSEAPSGEVESAQSAADSVISDFNKKFNRTTKKEFLNELPVRTVIKEKKIPYSELQGEKIKLGKASKRVFESEGAGGTYRQKTQKSLTDALRPIIEKQSPEMRGLNEQYRTYSALEEGMLDAMTKDYKKNPIISGAPIRNQILNKVLGDTGRRTRVASGLYNFANSPEIWQDMSLGSSDMLKKWIMLNQINNATLGGLDE